MTRLRLFPAILFLAFVVPTAVVVAHGRGHLLTDRPLSVCHQPSVPVWSLASFSRRRRLRSRQSGEVSETTLSLAAEYLRSRAAGAPRTPESVQAWNEFYPWCDDSIRRFASSLRVPAGEVDDCTQRVWADLLKSVPQFRLESSRGRFSTWLFTLVRSKAVDAARHRARRPVAALSPSLEARLGGYDTNPLIHLGREEDRQAVRRAIRKLKTAASELSFRVLHLRFFDRRSVRQVAEQLKLSPSQVWAREHRMKRKLLALLSR